MDETDRILVNALQDGLPVCERPFAPLAEMLDIDERSVVARIEKLLEDGILTRFGPMYDVERLGGAVSLCALGVAPERFDAVAAQVNAHPEVAHNYEREHALNMWFVLATENAARIGEVAAEIEAETGCRVLQLPKQQEFFVGLKLEI